jgi:transcriptional antiterminator
MAEATRAKLSASMMGNSNGNKHARKIQVIDLKLNTTITYISFYEAARALNISQPSISRYLNRGLRTQTKPIKGRYVIRKI